MDLSAPLHDRVSVSGGGVRPADGLLDAACPVSVQDPAVPVDNRHAGLAGRNVGSAFPPGKVNTQELCRSCGSPIGSLACIRR